MSDSKPVPPAMTSATVAPKTLENPKGAKGKPNAVAGKPTKEQLRGTLPKHGKTK